MAALSKAEYLKRYISGTDEENKKKKRKKKPKVVAAKLPRSVIVDDDVGWSDLKATDESTKQKQLEFETAGEDAPIVYDEDGTTMISTEIYKKREDDQKTKWAPIRADNDDEMKEGNDARSDSTRQQRRHDSPDLSPDRVARSDTPDNSPARHRQHGSPDLSPARNLARNKHSRKSKDSTRLRDKMSHDKDALRDGADMNSLRRLIRHDSDLVPPIRQRHDSDLTPPRRQRHDSDASPPRNTQRDRSPVQRRHHDSDAPPPRRARHDSPDQSPVRRGQHASPDLLPPCGGKASDSDQSPPRKRQDSRGKMGSDLDQSPPRRRSSSPIKGSKGGLLSANDLKQENTLKRKREAEMFATMDKDISGRGAQTVHRDKQGRKRDLEAEKQKKEEEEAIKAREDEKFNEWGKGVAQTKKARQRLEEDLHEMEKPLARYKDDNDLDNMLREQDRDDDPMLAYMQKKKATSDKKTGKKAKPAYKGPRPQPNRFGIQPGYRWDGVDRSNGFEKKRFAMLANKKATENMAHKWSVEDM